MLKNFYKKYLKKGDKIIIACSGGADSTYLTHLSAIACKELGVEAVLAHLNHKLRGEESEKDAKFVENLAKTLGYKSVIKSKKFTKFSEDKGRQARLEFFESTRKIEKAKYIILAHHKDDNLETIIMNFVRGAGLKGLSGMSKLSGNTLRPLLELSKSEILTYLKKHKIKYREDGSNKDNGFTRNYYRNVVIPSIKEKNPNLADSIIKNAENFEEIDNYLNKKANNWIKKHTHNKLYDLKSFRKQEKVIQKCILKVLYKQTKGDLQELESKHIEEVLKLLMESHSGKYKNLGKHTIVKIQAKSFSVTSL